MEVVVTGARGRSPLEPLAALVRAYSASARVNQSLVERLDPAVWRAELRGGRGDRLRTIAALVAHLHNCGLRYLVRTDPAADVPRELDRLRVTRAQAVRALGAKRKAVLRAVPSAIAAGRRGVGGAPPPARRLLFHPPPPPHHPPPPFFPTPTLRPPPPRRTTLAP